MSFRLNLIAIFLVLSLPCFPNDLNCSNFALIQKDRAYFRELLANWNRLDESNIIPNEVGLSRKAPENIEAWSVIDGSWHGDGSTQATRIKLAQELDFVDWQSFQQKFSDSSQKFKTAIGQRHYAFLVPPGGSAFLGSSKSNHYFSGKAIIEEGLRPHKVVKHFRELDGIQELVIVDDGSFSGSQIIQNLNDFFAGVSGATKLKVHMLIPFVSQQAKDLVKLLRKGKLSIDWYDTAVIRRASDVYWTPEELSTVDTNLHLTFFEHKIPDQLSTFPLIVVTKEGNTYTNSLGKFTPSSLDSRGSNQEELPMLFVPEYKMDENFYPLSQLVDALDAEGF